MQIGTTNGGAGNFDDRIAGIEDFGIWYSFDPDFIVTLPAYCSHNGGWWIVNSGWWCYPPIFPYKGSRVYTSLLRDDAEISATSTAVRQIDLR